jgi:hypothetical protein
MGLKQMVERSFSLLRASLRSVRQRFFSLYYPRLVMIAFQLAHNGCSARGSKGGRSISIVVCSPAKLSKKSRACSSAPGRVP